jgi:hypothetical protein
VTTPGDFDKFFGEVPQGFRRHEDGSQSLSKAAQAVQVLAAGILQEIQTLRSQGRGDEYVASYLATAIVSDMQTQKRKRGGKRGR